MCMELGCIGLHASSYHFMLNLCWRTVTMEGRKATAYWAWAGIDLKLWPYHKNALNVPSPFCLIPRPYQNILHGWFQLQHCKQLFVSCRTYCGFVHISEFIIPLTSVNATLGSTATFTCSFKRGSINWIVNGSTLQELNRTDITVSPTTVTSLYIPATEEYNNTSVFCYVAIRGEDFLRSDLVVLRVQGVLLMFC